MKNSHPTTHEISPTLVKMVRGLVFLFSKTIWRVNFHNKEKIPNELKSGLIIASNHQTYFDPFWICLPIQKDIRFMAWDKAFEWFLVGKLITKLGAFPISLKRGGTIKSLKASLDFLQNGKSLMIFPEGERGLTDGNLLKFKTGAVRLAMEADVPILPVTIQGGNQIWARGQKLPRFGKIDIYFHDLFYLPEKENSEESSEYVKKRTDELKGIIASQL